MQILDAKLIIMCTIFNDEHIEVFDRGQKSIIMVIEHRVNTMYAAISMLKCIDTC